MGWTNGLTEAGICALLEAMAPLVRRHFLVQRRAVDSLSLDHAA